MSPPDRPPLVPSERQPPLPLDRLVLAEPPSADAVEMDVVFVGGGPASLAGAIELARLSKARGGTPLEIAVLEKAENLGDHSVSGAVVDCSAFRALFPDVPEEEWPLRGRVEKERVYFLTSRRAWRVPTPPPMRNHGNRVGSLAEVVRWLGARAEAEGVHLFTGFPVESLLVEGTRVRGVRTTASGLRRDGSPGPNHVPPTDLKAKVVALGDGSRGSLSQAWLAWSRIASPNPQTFALGVKEVWETREPLDAVVHTMGWPLPRDVFGGSFLYPLGGRRVSLGLVVGLDAKRASVDTHELLQRLKTHPFLRRRLEGGELLEWAAKTIPEGGWWSLPERLSGDGAVLLGDAAGLVDVAALKGVHHAMASGLHAARAIDAALAAGDPSAARLSAYDAAVRGSDEARVLRRRRNMRLGFKKGFWRGAMRAALLTLTKGAFPGKRIETEADADVPRRIDPVEPFVPDGRLTFGKSDAVFRSGNKTRDDVPTHLIVGRDVPPELADLYARMCPAGVYERRGDALVVNAPNCVDCKATDVLGPRWTPREGGSGPHYRET